MRDFNHLMCFESYMIMGRTEEVKIINDNGDAYETVAKVDTGTYSARVSKEIAVKLQLPIVDKKRVWDSLGEEERLFVRIKMEVNGKVIDTEAGVADMTKLKQDVIIGRREIALLDGLVDIQKGAKGDDLEAFENIPDAVIGGNGAPYIPDFGKCACDRVESFEDFVEPKQLMA